MGVAQLILGALLVLMLLGLAGFYGWRQILVLRRLRMEDDPHSADSVYLRAQAWRRLISSGLMVLLAALLTGALVNLETPAQHLANARDQAEAERVEWTPTPEERSFIRFYSIYWIAFLLVLLAVVTLAFLDLLATRRYARSEYRKIQGERREMIARETARLRGDRNGYSELS